MSDPTRPIDPAELLAESEWLRALARALVRDPGAADDAAQNAAIAAIEHPPHGERRAWLFRVLRNFLRQHRRSEQRRARREVATARPEATTSTDLLERVETHRLLADLVASLPEPNRTAVILRFYEELEPAEIAARLGVPPGTVRARVHRGLAQLRDRLDAMYDGDRSRWLALAAPLATVKPMRQVGPGAARLVLGAAAVVFVAAGGALTWTLVVPGSGSTAGASSVAASVPAKGSARRAAATGRDIESASQATHDAVVVRGRIVDAAGAIARSAQLVVVADASAHPDGRARISATADLLADDTAIAITPCAEGTFTVTVPPGQSRTLRAEAAGLSSQSVVVDASRDRDDVVLVLERATHIDGEIVDVCGAPIAGASVAFVALPRREHTVSVRAATLADTSGRFNLEVRDDPGPGVGRFVAVRCPGYAPVFVRYSGAGHFVRVPLSRGAIVEGRVLDASGAPAPGARVCAVPAESDSIDTFPATVTARADDTGHFRVGPVGASERTRLDLVARTTDGWSGVLFDVTPPTGAPVTLELWQRATLRGRVVGPDGKPAPAVPFRLRGLMSVPMEWPSSGRSLARGTEMAVVSAADGSFETIVPAACTMVGIALEDADWDPAPVSRVVRRTSDAQVEFVLQRRDTVAGPNPEREGVTLSGRVEDEGGAPITGALVVVAGDPSSPGPAVRTDRLGAWRCGGLAPGTVEVVVEADGYGVTRVCAEVGATAGDALTIRVQRTVRVRGRVIDEDGSPVVGAVVVCHSEPDTAGSQARTDRDGRFDFPGRAGQATVAVCAAPGFECDGPSRSVDVPGAEMVFTLRPARRIEGRIEAPDGTPIVALQVRAIPRNASAVGASAFTDADGGFVLDGLRGGTYRLEAGDGAALDEVRAGTMDVRWRLSARATKAAPVPGK